jgi:hypothetical protein
MAIKKGQRLDFSNTFFAIPNTDNQITWTYSGNVKLNVSIVNRIATISAPNIDWFGKETITFRAKDPGNLYSQDAAIFTVFFANFTQTAIISKFFLLFLLVCVVVL